MKLFQRKDIIQEIKNGNEEILAHLAEKYFPSIRRLLRVRGLRDAETPEAFSHILAHVFVNLSKRKTVVDVDFEKYLLTSADDFVKNENNRTQITQMNKMNTDKEILFNHKDQRHQRSVSDDQIAAHCVSILDEHLQKLIYARVVEKLSYEKIAERFEYSNAVIAQYELDKAFQQLEGIVKLRLNVSLN